MRQMKSSRQAGIALMVVAALFAQAATAATLYWDPDGVQPTSGGTGTWLGNVWYDGTSYVTGGTGDDYILSAGSGSVANNTSRTINSLRVSSSGYTIAASEILFSSSATTTFTLDAGKTLTLNSRIRNPSTTMNMTIGSGATVTYGAAAGIGNSSLGGSLYGGGTLTINSGGCYLNATVGNSKISGGTTLNMNVSNGFQPGYLRIESGSTNKMNGSVQGDITGATIVGDLYGVTVTGAGSQWLGGGTASRLAIRGSTSGPTTAMGTLSILDSATFATGGGQVALLSTGTGHDDADLVISGGGALALGNNSGRLLLGFATDGALADTMAVNLTLSGGGNISNGQILLTTHNSAAKTRVVTVADSSGDTAVDFTISAAIADGNQSGSGITKAGAGTLTLSGTNTYTGTTTVNSGTLVFNGKQATSRFAIGSASAATLNGSGTIKVTSGAPIVVNANGTLDMAGLNFDLSAFTAGPVPVANYSAGGTVTGRATAGRTAGWILRDYPDVDLIQAVRSDTGTAVMIR